MERSMAEDAEAVMAADISRKGLFRPPADHRRSMQLILFYTEWPGRKGELNAFKSLRLRGFA